MIRTVMESANLAAWPIASLLLFAVFTCALALWLYRKGSKPFYDRMSRMAMDDGATDAPLAYAGNQHQADPGSPERNPHGNA